MDRETLALLLRGHHLDMPERIRRGVWPHPPLKLSEVLEVLADCILNNHWFPRPWQRAQAGCPVHEGGTVERINPTRFIYRAQRAHPIQPTVLAETVETTFCTAEDAARHYAKWDLQLPGKLDGWKVLED